MRNFERAFYEPALSDSQNVESWEEAGSSDMRQNAHERWIDMLQSYEGPPMDIARREEVSAIVTGRKAELTEAWY